MRTTARSEATHHPKRSVVVIGGGIAGLSAAFYLQADPKWRVTLLEGIDRFGGKIQTRFEDNLVVEQGPDSIFTAKPAALELMIELGLEDQIIEPGQSDFSILVKGKLRQVPRGFASLMPTPSNLLEHADFFGAGAWRRVLREKDVPAGSGSDESIASFFRRRFGRTFSSLLAEPLLAGIHAGDPERLSMKALYPAYLGLEQKMGRLTELGEPAGKSRKPGFVSLRGGMESLVKALLGRLESVDLRLSCPVTKIERDGAHLRVHLESGDGLDADALVLAVPAPVASRLLADLSPDASAKLNEIRHTSTAVVSLAYPADAIRLQGNGFLVPTTESCGLTGCTWSSKKWPGRSPGDIALMRCFMGRDGGLDVDTLDDRQLADLATTEIARILEVKVAPTYQQVVRWTKAMPQKELGHSERLCEIERAIADYAITLIGASYRASGIPDCVREGKEAALRVITNNQ